MAIITPIYTIKSKLDSIPVVAGQFIIITDYELIAYDDRSGNRHIMTEIIWKDTEAEMFALLAPITNKLYITKDTNCMYKYDSGWKKFGVSKTIIEFTSGDWVLNEETNKKEYSFPVDSTNSVFTVYSHNDDGTYSVKNNDVIITSNTAKIIADQAYNGHVIFLS